MNYIRHLTGFFDRIVLDEKLNPTHISLYIALFQYWNVNRFKNPISISRSEIMRISKISAKATYHKCMRELHDLGYIRYQPSYNPFKGSLVFLMELDKPLLQEGSSRPQRRDGGGRPNPRQLLNKQQTGDEQALVPSLNSSNISNNQNEREVQPEFPEVEQFFKQNKYPHPEANKFFNHYKAIGWKIQGITPIEDWKALAEKWMQNAAKWETHIQTQPGQPLTVDQLYQDYLAGKKIFQQITPDQFAQLGLPLTTEILTQARDQRINQLAGTNNHSMSKLWEAYLTGNPTDPLVLEDEPKLNDLAKRITVLNHFQLLKQSGKALR